MPNYKTREDPSRLYDPLIQATDLVGSLAGRAVPF